MQRIYPTMNSSTINHNEIEIHSLFNDIDFDS